LESPLQTSRREQAREENIGQKPLSDVWFIFFFYKCEIETAKATGQEEGIEGEIAQEPQRRANTWLQRLQKTKNKQDQDRAEAEKEKTRTPPKERKTGEIDVPPDRTLPQVHNQQQESKHNPGGEQPQQSALDLTLRKALIEQGEGEKEGFWQRPSLPPVLGDAAKERGEVE
jgi:hypothetical protein